MSFPLSSIWATGIFRCPKRPSHKLISRHWPTAANSCFRSSMSARFVHWVSRKQKKIWQKGWLLSKNDAWVLCQHPSCMFQRRRHRRTQESHGDQDSGVWRLSRQSMTMLTRRGHWSFRRQSNLFLIDLSLRWFYILWYPCGFSTEFNDDCSALRSLYSVHICCSKTPERYLKKGGQRDVWTLSKKHWHDRGTPHWCI